MGLDMYLVKNEDFSQEIAYWRKANAIHNWFVSNVQNGEDDCGYYEVSKDKLEELMQLCITVGVSDSITGNNYSAMKDLPTTNGFFFGSTDYDEYYYDTLKRTGKMLKEVLETFDFENDKLYYTSSW